jgi:16S rRNA A1518/A1519 N6-dimethyltransferase RsmA/KsgA/DIM1 with predicted DNA glycosylase/AP lyase activity
MKGKAPAKGEIIARVKITLKVFKNNFSPEPALQFQSNLVQIILG